MSLPAKQLRYLLREALGRILNPLTLQSVFVHIDELIAASVQEETQKLRQQVDEWCTLAMQGEALRAKVLLDSILGKHRGDFQDDHDAKVRFYGSDPDQ